MAARRKALTDAIVRPRCRLWHQGRTYLPGERLTLPDEDFDELQFRRVVDEATPENVAAIEDAIAKRLPIPCYVSAGDDENADVTSPRQLARRAHQAKHRRE